MDKYLKRLMKKVNPIAKMLTSTTFRQQTLASKKLYNRKKTNMRESLANMIPSQEKRKEKFYNEMNTKIIHTKTFHCDDDHPIVYYTVDENNKGVCEYCYTKFIYEPL